MDKKTGIIIGIICAVMVVLLCVVFVMDSKFEDIPSDVLVTVDGERFTIDDYKKFEKLTNFEAGDAKKEMTLEDTNQMFTDFVNLKTYCAAAKKKNISGDSTDYMSQYDEKSGDLTAIGITKEEYEKIKQETALSQKLQNSMTDYYDVPEDYYNDIVNQAKELDAYYTYTYRVMQIPYEEKSGDALEPNEEASGETIEDTSGENTTTEASGEPEKDVSKEAQELIANDVVTKIRSGEDFEKLSEEFGQYRIIYTKNGLSFTSGGLEYATGLVLDSKLGNNDEVYDAVLALNPGECTDPIDVSENHLFEIVKVETKEEGFSGDALDELNGILLDQVKEGLVAQDVKVEFNQAGYYRLVY